MAMNPIYSAVVLFRSAFVSAPVQIDLALISVVSAIFFFVVGLYYFRKTESFFADIA